MEKAGKGWICASIGIGELEGLRRKQSPWVLGSDKTCQSSEGANALELQVKYTIEDFRGCLG